MEKLTRKTYNKKLSKQYIAENEFFHGKNNQEVCDYLNLVSGKTSINDVEVMRCRYEKKKKKLLSETAKYHIDDKDVKNEIKKAIKKVASTISTKELKEEHSVDIFKMVLSGK